MDEPYEGLAPVIVEEIEKTPHSIRSEGITTIIVKQNAVAALKLADKSMILDTGEIFFSDLNEPTLHKKLANRQPQKR